MRKQKAFTIIEVVLVLAVAGLIFLVVFAAIPRLQASRRDNARKRDAEALLSLLIEYESNTGTSLSYTDFSDALIYPANATAMASPFYDYIDDTPFVDPGGSDYARVGVANTPNEGQFSHAPNYGCSADKLTLVTGTGKSFGINMGLERGNYCIDTEV